MAFAAGTAFLTEAATFLAGAACFAGGATFFAEATLLGVAGF